MKASLTLLLLCGIVFFSNYRLKKLSAKVTESVKTMYQDRLVVQDIIFSYGKIVTQIENMSAVEFSQNVKNTVSVELLNLNQNYGKTVFTDEETIVFNSFSKQLNAVLNGSVKNTAVAIRQLRQNLNRLEEIQMEEAEKQMAIIDEANGNQEISFYLETGILVILLVIVQLLLVSNTTIQKVAKGQSTSLN